jgi:outer membrane protein TolC
LKALFKSRRKKMNKRTIGTFVFLSLFFVQMSFSQQKENSLSLSLQDCILKALKNNLGVAIQVLSPELADISVTQAGEKFWPGFSFSLSRRNTNQASYSFLESNPSANPNVITRANTYSGGISQLVPTGGTFSVTMSNSATNTNQLLQTINPRYSSTLTFNFNQPLLQSFGFKANRKDIIIARNNLDISETQLKGVLQNTIYSVEQAYWNLVYSIDYLNVTKQSLQLAQDLLEKNQRSVEVGTLAPIEVLSAQSAVATREADILQAEAQVKNNQDILKTIINLPVEEGRETAEIIPVDKPAYQLKEISLEEALRTAIENRPELKQMKISLQNSEISLSYIKNQLLPNLSLQASYWSPGLSGTEIQYDPHNPFGAPIGTIAHGSAPAWKDVFNFKYPNWSLGLNLTLPLNNVFSRASYAQAKVNLQQAELSLKNQEQQIYLEIKQTVRAVQTNYKRVQAYKVARELAEKKLQAEEERLRVGLSTSYFVLQYQTDLTTARTNELNAIIAYNLSLAGLDRAMGISLKTKNINLSEIPGNKLSR